MVHSGYEPTAVSETFGTLRGFLTTVKATLWGTAGPRQPTPPSIAVRPEERLPVVVPEAPVRERQLANADLPIVQLDR
jgi:hypothetical protein